MSKDYLVELRKRNKRKEDCSDIIKPIENQLKLANDRIAKLEEALAYYVSEEERRRNLMTSIREAMFPYYNRKFKPTSLEKNDE